LTADLDLAVNHADIFAGEELLSLVWKLLLVLEFSKRAGWSVFRGQKINRIANPQPAKSSLLQRERTVTPVPSFITVVFSDLTFSDTAAVGFV
jgi:hypothetical protein